MRILRIAVGVGVLAMASIMAHGQVQTLPTMDSMNRTAYGDKDPAKVRAERLHQELVKEERQKKMKSASERLLAVAAELKDVVAKEGPDAQPADVLKKIAEIERLAHEVQVRMRG